MHVYSNYYSTIKQNWINLTEEEINLNAILIAIVITSYEMNSSSKTFKHIAWIQECINRKAKTHNHHKQTN